MEITHHHKDQTSPKDWKKGDVILGRKNGRFCYFATIWDGEKEVNIQDIVTSGTKGIVPKQIDILEDNIDIWCPKGKSWVSPLFYPQGFFFHCNMVPYVDRFVKVCSTGKQLIYSFSHGPLGDIIVIIPYKRSQYPIDESYIHTPKHSNEIIPKGTEELSADDLRVLFTQYTLFTEAHDIKERFNIENHQGLVLV